VLKHIASNWTLNLLQILVMMVLAPILVEGLGRDGNGIWVAIVATTFFLELLALGIPMASVRHISEAVAAKDHELERRVVATGLWVTIALGVAGLALGGILFWPFETRVLGNESWAETPAETISAARIAYFITAFRVATSLALRFPAAVFDAHRDFTAKNAVLGAGILFRAAAVIVMVRWNPSLVWLAWIFVAEAVLVFAALRFLILRRHPEVRFGLSGFDRGLVVELFGFGIFAAILNVGSLIAFQIDSLVIGVFTDLGPDAITDFDFGNKFFMPLAGLMFGIGAVIMPTATAMKVAGDERALEHIFLKWSKISLSVLLPIGLYLTVLGPRFLAAWIGPEYEGVAGQITRILAPSFIIFLTLRAVALPILLGTARPGRAAGALLVAALLNLTLSIVLVKLGHGLVGVALGTAIPNVLFAAYILMLTCKHLRVGILDWLRYVTLRVVIGTVPPLALLLWLEHGLDVRGFPQLIASGVAMMVVFGAVWFFFVYRDDPYLDPREELALRLRRGQ
jgi:O-antigen/teichoic acid export membrane protein